MRVARVRAVGVGPFEDITLSLLGDDDSPRPITVVHGSGAVGKTSLLMAIASTRPGAISMPVRSRGPRTAQPFAVVDWVLGADAPNRPHVLRLSTPGATLDEPDELAVLRRREQALFDRKAAEGGFVLVHVPAMRWFSRAPILIASPERTLLRNDARAGSGPDDASRGDLTRETKQTLAFAALASGVARPDAPVARRIALFDRALRHAVNALAGLTGHAFVGVDPLTFEPLFSTPHAESTPFDDLPTATRQLTALAALTVRPLFAAYPDRDPLDAEGVVLVDEIGLHLDSATERRVIPALRGLLPRVQWVITTSSALVASSCTPSELLALRRTPTSSHIELHEGAAALLH